MDIVNELSEKMDVTKNFLLSEMDLAPLTYKEFNIKKRNGGNRLIAQPTKWVKKVQREIVLLYLSDFNISKSSFAYMENISIKDNARVHVKNKIILKMDFENFFPSIKPMDLISVFEKVKGKLNNLDKLILIKYLFRKVDGSYELSVGAPSSPIISNIIMMEFDEMVEEYCLENEINYSRYADDITFSSNEYEKLEKTKKKIFEIVRLENFPFLKINEKKTIIVNKSSSRRVTGVILTNDQRVSVGDKLRRRIRTLLYLYSNDRLKDVDVPYLHGIVSHVKNIEPEFYNKINKKYGDDFFKILAKKSFSISKEIRSRKY